MPGANFVFRALVAGTPGNLINIAMVDPLAINQPLGVVVVGNAITVNLATDGAGILSSTYTDVVTLLNGTAASAALIMTFAFGAVTGTATPFGITFLSGGGGGSALLGSDPPVKITLYDASYRALSQAPVMITYVVDPDPFGPRLATTYLSGAVIPPLLYPQFSQLRIDVTSLLSGGQWPQTLDFQLRGIQRYPC